MLAEILSPEVREMILEGVPVIISLIIIEGLLSVDNALGIAAMASHLPGKQKYWALRVGIFWVLLSPFRLFFKKAHIPEPIEEVEHALEILHDAEEREKHAP
jgi:predicted tellurium resistance membrane protein TerC